MRSWTIRRRLLTQLRARTVSTDLHHLDASAEGGEECPRDDDLVEFAQAAGGFGVFEFNFRTREIRGTSLFFDLIGLPDGTDPALKLEEFLATIHPQDFETVIEVLGEALSSGLPYSCEYRICHPDGRVRWIGEKGRVTYRADGQVARVVGALIDITDLKGAQEALGSIEGRLERALRGTQDGLWEVDLQRQSNWYGYRFAELLGYTTEELGSSRQHFH